MLHIPCNLSKIPRAELIEIIDKIPEKYRPDLSDPLRTNADRRAFIDLCRRNWIEEINAARVEKLEIEAAQTEIAAGTRAAAPDLCKITAAECNAWLRSLPEIET